MTTPAAVLAVSTDGTVVLLCETTAGTDLFLKQSTGTYREALAGRGFGLVGFQDDSHAVAVSRIGLLSLSDNGGETWEQSTP